LAIGCDPCRNMERLAGSSPLEARTTSSSAGVPVAPSSAPPVSAEFSQPRPVAPSTLQGQAVVSCGSPAPQEGVNGEAPPESVPSIVQPLSEPVSWLAQSSITRLHTPLGPLIDVSPEFAAAWVHWPVPKLKYWS